MVLVAIISSFFFATNVKAYFTGQADRSNRFSIAPVYTVDFHYYYIDDEGNDHEYKDSVVEKVFKGHVYNIGDNLDSSLDYSEVKHYINGNVYTDPTYAVLRNSTIDEVYMLRRYDVLFKYSYIDENDIKHQLQDSVTEHYNKGRVINIGDNLLDEDYSSVKHEINGVNHTANTYTIQGEDTIEEIYYLNRYNIVYHLDGGTVDSPNPTVYTARTGTITLNNPTKDKYEFLGWTWDGEDTPQLDVSFESTDKEDKEFFANFRLLDTPATVIYEQMNLDGNGYTEVERNTVMLQPGTSWTPEVFDYEGFTSPEEQTVTVDGEGNTVVTYRYVRNKYKLEIFNSEFVTPTTQSGEYYYGTSFVLEAADHDDLNAPFTKWNTGELGQLLSFTMTEDKVVGPYYGDPHELTINYNGGYEADNMFEGPLIKQYYRGEPIDYPEIIKETCSVHGEGAPESRGCSYVAELLGWYTDSDLENQVPSDYVMPDTDVILYAGWNGIYYHYLLPGEKTFGGTAADLIDTDVNIYNIENRDRDFKITFDILEIDDYNPENQATIMNAKDEQNIIQGTGNVVPGFVVRLLTNNKNQFELKGAWGKKQTGFNINRSSLPMHMEITRVNGVVKARYCTINASGECTGRYTEKDVYDESSWTPPHPSKLNVVFGASQDINGNYNRFFHGKLANMEVKVEVDEQNYIGGQ